jgi:hypothetical protein
MGKKAIKNYGKSRAAEEVVTDNIIVEQFAVVKQKFAQAYHVAYVFKIWGLK